MPEPRTTYKIHRIPYQNHENHKKKSITGQNYENNEIHRIQRRIMKIKTKIIIPSQNYENHEILRF